MDRQAGLNRSFLSPRVDLQVAIQAKVTDYRHSQGGVFLRDLVEACAVHERNCR
jgi:hypothetical protein